LSAKSRGPTIHTRGKQNKKGHYFIETLQNPHGCVEVNKIL